MIFTNKKIIRQIVICAFFQSIKPIITRLWTMLYLLHNFRGLVSDNTDINFKNPLISLYPLFIGLLGLIIFIPLITLLHKYFKRQVFRDINNDLKRKYTLILARFDFLWTHVICMILLVYIIKEYSAYIFTLYLLILIFCFYINEFICWYLYFYHQKRINNLVSDVIFKNVGFGVYILITAVYIAYVGVEKLTFFQLFALIVIPRFMLAKSEKFLTVSPRKKR